MSFLSFKYLDSNTITLVAGRNSKKTYSQYLRGADGVPYNEMPFIVPFNCFLKTITASSKISDVWTVKIRSSGVDIIGANLTVNNTNYNIQNYSIQLSQGQPLEIYLETINGIEYPTVNLVLQKNI